MLDGHKTNLNVKVRGKEDSYLIITNACTKLQWVKISIRQRENQALIHWLGMSAASLERNADWWESFITHAVCPDPPPSETMQSHTRSHRQTYACVMHPSRLWHLLWCHHSTGRRQLSYSDSPKSHNTPSNTHTCHSTPWVSMPPPHHSSPSFLPWHQPGSLLKLHLYNQLLSGTTRTLPAAQSRSVGHILFVDLQLDYPIMNGKYLGKWGLNICAIWSRTPHCEVVGNM